jgi:pimeloyl-ACP methyl ester carboxylesterase
MRTELVRVAEGIELAVDTWAEDGRIADAWPSEGDAIGGRATAPAARAPFVLVHGLASNARLWDGVAARMVELGHSAVTLDLRGHGRSDKPDGPYDVPTVADDLAVLISTLGLDRPIVVGQSWGGNVALELAARHRAAARGVVCVDGGWLEPSAAFVDWEACLRALAPPRIAGRPLAENEAYLRSAHPDWTEAAIRGALANFEVRPDGTVAPWLTYDRHVTILRGLWEHHPKAVYPLVEVPVLLVPADTGDPAWTARKRRDVDAAAAALPAARVRWFTGDHDIHAQHPGELADVMVTLARDGFFG